MVWLSPNHPDYGKVRQTPPPEEGKILARFARPSRPGDEHGDQELRLVALEYNGSPFLSLRLAEKNNHGEYWPVKGRSVSIRMGEVAGLAAALNDVEMPARREPTPQRPRVDQASRPNGPVQGYANPAHPSTANRPSGPAGRPPWEDDPSADPERPTFVERRRRPEPIDPGRSLPAAPEPEATPFSEID